MNRSSNHELAIYLATKMALPVFPCREIDHQYTDRKTGKIRTLKAKAPYTRNGFKDASCDPGQIDVLWARNPNAVPGVPMGLVSNLVAVDIDQGNGKNGEASFAATGLIVPATVQTRTVSGGRHIFFRYPDGEEIRNSTSTVFGDNVDVRAEGGYVIWAQAQMHQGTYEYIIGYSPEDVDFAELPDEFLTRLKKASSKPSPSLFNHRASITEGSRNSSLFQATVTQVHGGASENQIFQAAEVINKTYSPPLYPEEVERTVQSALRYKRNDTFPYTDLGNAERFRRDHEGKVVYVIEAHSWFFFDGTRWLLDNAVAGRLAHETVRAIVLEAGSNPSSLQEAIKWQRASESNARLKAMLDIASTLENMTIQQSELDRKPLLFNTTSGTYELKAGKMREHKPSDFLSQIADCAFDMSATAPRWEQFIAEITDDDPETQKYLQKLCGYMLLGERVEQKIVFLIGDGGDGKTVFIETIKELLGTYQTTLAATSLSAKNNASIPNDIARLRGKRLVSISELPKNLRLNTQLVKGVSGGDTMTARFLHQEFFDFDPIAQIVIATNFYPYADPEDKAFFRRLAIVRFPRCFTDCNPDKRLRHKLSNELNGILNWALIGLKMYQDDGLKSTSSMDEELDYYKRFSEPLYGFIENCIERTTDRKAFVFTDYMVETAQKFVKEEDRRAVSKAEVIAYLQRRGITRVQRRGNDSKKRDRGYAGLKLVHYREDDIPF